MKTEKELFDLIEIAIQRNFKEIMEKLDEINATITLIHFEAELSQEIKNEFGVPNIRIIIEAKDGSADVVYFYKDRRIDPIFNEHSELGELSIYPILLQCEIQNTHKPDISFLGNIKNLN